MDTNCCLKICEPLERYFNYYYNSILNQNQFTFTIGYWFGVTGSHGMEAIERNMIIPAY